MIWQKWSRLLVARPKEIHWPVAFGIHDKFGALMNLRWDRSQKRSAFLSACSSFFFALGLQWGQAPDRTLSFKQNPPSQVQQDLFERPNERLLCKDGSKLNQKIVHSGPFRLTALLELGDQARKTFRECLCKDFKGGICESLRFELQDDFEERSDFASR